MRTKQVCFHLARDVRDGEYQRIRKLQNDINVLTSSDYYEFQVVGLISFLKRPSYFLKLPVLVKGGTKRVLPILLPGERYIGVICSINQWIGKICGAFIGLLLKPEYCIGETHSSFPMISGVKITSPKSQIVFDLHGAFPEEIEYIYESLRRKKLLVDHINVIEKKLLNLSDITICQSDAMANHLEQKNQYVINRKVIYQCGVDTNVFLFSSIYRKEIRARLDISETELVFVYLGGLHRWQLVDSVLHIYSEFSNQNPKRQSKLLIITNESENFVVQIAERYGISCEHLRVISVPHDDVPQYLCACDYGFLLREDTILNRVACPTKLGEYLACGIPIITSPIAQYWSWTKGESDSVCIVDHTTPIEAAMKIWTFVDNRELNFNENSSLACRRIALKKLSKDQDLSNLKLIFGGK